MAVDLLIRALGGLLVLVNSLFPQFPPAVTTLVTSISNGIESLSGSIPYGDLLPWGVFSAALAGTPVVFGWAIVARGIRSAVALVRSRGVNDI